jgi:hypothetical protein
MKVPFTSVGDEFLQPLFFTTQDDPPIEFRSQILTKKGKNHNFAQFCSTYSSVEQI